MPAVIGRSCCNAVEGRHDLWKTRNPTNFCFALNTDEKIILTHSVQRLKHIRGIRGLLIESKLWMISRISCDTSILPRICFYMLRCSIDVDSTGIGFGGLRSTNKGLGNRQDKGSMVVEKSVVVDRTKTNFAVACSSLIQA